MAKVNLRSKEEIEKIRQSSLLVSKTHAEVAKFLQPGMKTIELDKIAEEFIRDNGGIPAFKGYHGFTGSLCISVNEEVVHGIPGNRVIEEGDIVSVDCGVLMNGYYGDSAYSFAMPGISEENINLLKVTLESLKKGITFAAPGKRLGDLSHAIQHYAESHGCSVVRELVGHGIGTNLHEAPEVPNYGRPGNGPLLKAGMVIAIEPMINLGKKEVLSLSDGWTIVTRDRKASAHFEHTVAITEQGSDILSDFRLIEESIKNNKNIVEVALWQNNH